MRYDVIYRENTLIASPRQFWRAFWYSAKSLFGKTYWKFWKILSSINALESCFFGNCLLSNKCDRMYLLKSILVQSFFLVITVSNLCSINFIKIQYTRFLSIVKNFEVLTSLLNWTKTSSFHKSILEHWLVLGKYFTIICKSNSFFG